MGQYRRHVFVGTTGETCPTPRLVVYPDDVWYGGVRASELFESHILGGRPIERLVYSPGVKGPNKQPGVH